MTPIIIPETHTPGFSFHYSIFNKAGFFFLKLILTNVRLVLRISNEHPHVFHLGYEIPPKSGSASLLKIMSRSCDKDNKSSSESLPGGPTERDDEDTPPPGVASNM